MAERDRLLEVARQAREGLAEAELRHAVGEFDPARFEEARSRHTAELDGLETELNELSERITALEDVHSAVTRPAAAAPAEPEPAVAEEVTPEPEPLAQPEVEPAADLIDEGEALLSIFDEGPPVELVPPSPDGVDGSPRGEP